MSGRITKRTVDALKPGELVWDAHVKGFGVRRQKDAVSYFFRYRAGKGRSATKRYMTIGLHGAEGWIGGERITWTPDTAARQARIWRGDAEAGRDPAGAAKQARPETLAALCDLYLEASASGLIVDRSGNAKRASTLETDRYRVAAHIKPLLGKRRVVDISRADIESFLQLIAQGKVQATGRRPKARGRLNARGGRGAATRTTGLLGAILSYGVQLGIRADNPASGVRRYADGRRDRRLTDGEFEALGKVLVDPTTSTVLAAACAITHLLAVTGWRRGEVINLRWAEVDLSRKTAKLSVTKTGRSIRPLSNAACTILQAMTPKGAFVFPARAAQGQEDQPTQNFGRQFRKLRDVAGLPADISPHVLRHTFASVGADLGYSDSTIGALIGHRGRTITSRYTHAADAVLVAAADAIASAIESQMFARPISRRVVTFPAQIERFL